MIPKVPMMERPRIERENLDLAPEPHPSEAMNERVEKARLESLARLKDAVSGLRAGNPKAWETFCEEFAGLHEKTKILLSTNPWEFMATRTDAAYYAICIAHAQGQLEVLDTIFAATGAIPTGEPSPTSPLKQGHSTPGPRVAAVFRKVLDFFRGFV